MARKKAPPAPPRPGRDRVQQLLASGDFREAFAQARQFHSDDPTAENLALLKRVISAAAADLGERDENAAFNRLMDEADSLDPENPEWAAERACLLARGGRLADALIRADDATRPRVLGFASDRALRIESKEFLPDELHAGFDAIVAAFQAYERRQDDEARLALESIGLRSPFLEWKVLLRGLMAHAAGDDARAAENFARLDPQRLPHRLAAPYRHALDPAWRARLAAKSGAELAKQFASLNSSGIITHLREIAKHLGRDRPMQPAFRAAEAVIPALKNRMPRFLERLANCLYHALMRQGQPDDLARFRRLFGQLPGDPGFFKLQARIAEEIGELEVANQNWIKHDEWLAKGPVGWPAPLVARVRGMVWHRMGVNADRALNEPEEDDLFAPFKKLKRPEPIGPGPIECFLRATALAPDWEPAAKDCFAVLWDEERFEAAEQVARRLLAHRPDSLEGLSTLADLLQKQQRSAEALELVKRAQAADPLNKPLARRVAFGVLALARTLLIAKKTDEAAECLASHSELLHNWCHSSSRALGSVIAMKSGDRERASALCTEAHTALHRRLEAAFRIAVDSQLAKLKPADRKAADQRLAEAMTAVPDPAEVANLLQTFDLYLEEGLTYRGQKSQMKKFLALVPRTLDSKAADREFEILGMALRGREEYKAAKSFAAACTKKFPKNPFFPLLEAGAALKLGDPPYKFLHRLEAARRLAERATEQRHKDLLPQIDELIGMAPDPFSFLDAFFKR